VSALFLLLALTALVLPSRLGVFAGLPLDSWPEFVLLVLLLPLAVSSRLRDEAAAPLGRRGLRVATAALGLTLGIKVALLIAAPNAGFDSCYRSTLQPPRGDCEVSFADPFRLSGATRVDQEFDFGLRPPSPLSAGQASAILTGAGPLSESNWNLSFFNDLRFGGYRPGEPDRDRVPFSLRSSGPVEFDSGGRLRVLYVGEGRLEVGGRAVELPPSYDRLAELTLPVDAGRHELRLAFAYRPVAVLPEPGGAPTAAPYAILGIASGADPLGAAPAPSGWRLAAATADAILIVLALGLALRWAWLLRAYAPLAVGVGVAIASGALLDSEVDLGPLASFGDAFWNLLALVALLGVLLARPGPRPLHFAWFAVVAIAVARTFEEFPYEDSTFYPTGGGDPLTYASQAGEILTTWSPEGGEEVFGTQPGFRYLLFAGRLVFGAADPWLAAAALSAVLFAVFLVTWMLRPPAEAGTGRRVAALAVGALLLGVVMSSQVVGAMRVHQSEWVTWVLLPLAAALLFGSDRPRWWLVGAALLGLEVATRQNQGPLVVVLLLAFVLSVAPARRLAAVACCGAALLVGLLPLAHNLVYGQRFEILTTSGVTAADDPAEVTGTLGSAENRELFARQFAAALYLDPGYVDAAGVYTRSPDLKPFVYGLELAWLIAVGFAVVRRRRFRVAALVMLAAPLAALGVFASYSPVSYYPRHVVIGYLAFGIALLYLLSERSRRGGEHDHDPGGGQREGRQPAVEGAG
jgi:hypothetical protein